MATKFTYKNEVGRKWDVGSGTHPTQTKFKKERKKKNVVVRISEAAMGRGHYTVRVPCSSFRVRRSLVGCCVSQKDAA